MLFIKKKYNGEYYKTEILHCVQIDADTVMLEHKRSIYFLECFVTSLLAKTLLYHSETQSWLSKEIASICAANLAITYYTTGMTDNLSYLTTNTSVVILLLIFFGHIKEFLQTGYGNVNGGI